MWWRLQPHVSEAATVCARCGWGAPFRIRHCGTGKVLAVSSGQTERHWASRGAPAERALLTPSGRAALARGASFKADEVLPLVLTDERGPETHFLLVPQYPTEGRIAISSFVRVCHVTTGAWLHAVFDEIVISESSGDESDNADDDDHRAEPPYK